MLKAPEKDRDSISVGTLRAARWSGSPRALEHLESLKLCAKFADANGMVRVIWINSGQPVSESNSIIQSSTASSKFTWIFYPIQGIQNAVLYVYSAPI